MQWRLHHEEAEVASVRLYGRWPPRVGLVPGSPVTRAAEWVVSYRSCFDDYVPIQRSVAESEPQERNRGQFAQLNLHGLNTMSAMMHPLQPTSPTTNR